MARHRPKMAAETVREEIARPTVFVLKILQPVWLNTAKARRGDIVTVDADLADRLILNKQAEPYVAA